MHARLQALCAQPWPHPVPCPQLSRLGGLTARVGELLEALPGGSSCGAAPGAHHSCVGSPSGGLHTVRLSMDGREMQPSRFAVLLQPPRMLR